MENAKKQGDAFWKWFTKAYAIPQRSGPKPKWEWNQAKNMGYRADDSRGWTWQMDADTDDE